MFPIYVQHFWGYIAVISTANGSFYENGLYCENWNLGFGQEFTTFGRMYKKISLSVK